MMNKLRGTVMYETDKAIQFKITEDILLHLTGKTLWFPKSKIKLPKNLYKETISIYVPDWMYDSKVVVLEDER
jgi:hypothetical protein